MEKLKPLLKKLSRNIDRVAIVAFVVLTGTVIYLWQMDQGAPAQEMGDVPPTDMPAHFDDSEGYLEVLRNVSWDGEMFAKRPLDDDNPFIDLIRLNIFVDLGPTESNSPETFRQIQQMLEAARADFNQAQQESNPEFKIEQLQQCVRTCERILTVWAAQSEAQQTEALDLRNQAQAQLDSLLGTGEES